MSSRSRSATSTLAGSKPITCLSADSHSGVDITNNVSHYLGCIEFGERQAFYETLQDDERKPIKAELRRIEYLRRVIETSEDASDKTLLDNATDSMINWRKVQGRGIRETSEWRRLRGKSHGDTSTHDPNEGRRSDTNNKYDPIKDLNAYVIELENSEGVTNRTKDRNGEPMLKGKFPNQKISVERLLNDEVNLLHKDNVKKEEGQLPSTIRYFHFPANNMKWVQEAMARYYGEENPEFDNTYRKTKNRTRSNTLLRRNLWLGQEQGRGSQFTHSRHLRPLCEPASSDIYGSDAEKSQNVVLFMPFLHWELDRQRKNFSDLIDKTSIREQIQARKEEEEARESRRMARQGLHLHHTPMRNDHAFTMGPLPSARNVTNLSTMSAAAGARPLTSFMENWMDKQPSGMLNSVKVKYPRRDKTGRLRTSSPLGQLLYDAFRLYETMNNYRDRKLIDGYLHNEPPLHTRRTLDQAYYWTLSNTRARDRDQVVYRGTSAPSSSLHHYRPEANEAERWSCRAEEHHAKTYENEQTTFELTAAAFRRLANRESQELRPELPLTEPSTSISLESHRSQHGQATKNAHEECLVCREAIQKVPRIVMVDQLWMWVLDDSTIITFFPKRYGINRQDPSGVHKSIRQRFANVSKNDVRSAYDVALIIIDECSNLFFDRTKTDSQQPQVVDIFSEAIGNMAQKSTISFQHLWHWANELAKAPTNKASWVDLSQLHVALLNITPEGKLQRETKDIIEELGIMLYISQKQKEVLKSFKRHAGSMLDPRRARIESQQDHLAGLSQMPYSPPAVGEFPINDRSEIWELFRDNVKEVLQEHDDHLEELEGLQKSAEQVNRNLDHLLSMKQQQASVLQAWQAIRHGEEAVKQGRSIMIFTVITIIFLPLAFVAAIFGMNNSSFKDDKMELKLQLQLMFGSSIGVIILVIFAAFSNTIRSLVWSIAHVCLNWIVVNSGLYYIWLDWFPEHLKPEKLMRWAQTTVQERKEEIRKQVRRKRRRNYEARRKILEEKEQISLPIATALLPPKAVFAPLLGNDERRLSGGAVLESEDHVGKPSGN